MNDSKSKTICQYLETVNCFTLLPVVSVLTDRFLTEWSCLWSPLLSYLQQSGNLPTYWEEKKRSFCMIHFSYTFELGSPTLATVPAIGVQILDCRRNVRSIWNLNLKQGNLEGCRRYNIFCMGYSSTNGKAISLPIWSVLQIACTQSSPAKHTWTQTLTLRPPFWLLLLPSLFEQFDSTPELFCALLPRRESSVGTGVENASLRSV